MYYELENDTLNLLKSYLDEIVQFVQIGETNSHKLSRKLEVPQLPILGSLLFYIIINDLRYSGSVFELVMYTDDTTLVSTLEIVEAFGDRRDTVTIHAE